MCRVCLNTRKTKIDLKIAEAWKFSYIEKSCNTNNSNVGLFGGGHRGLRC